MLRVFGLIGVQIHHVDVSHFFAVFDPIKNPVRVYVWMKSPRATGNTVAALPPSAHKHVTGNNCQTVRVFLCFVSVVYFDPVRVCVVCCGLWVCGSSEPKEANESYANGGANKNLKKGFHGETV